MSQILNNFLDKKLKLEEDIKKININIESNKHEIYKLYKEIVTIRRAIRNRKKRNKKYDDLYLRISEIKNSIKHYRIDTIMLQNRVLEFENLKNIILSKIEKAKADLENMDQNNMKRCESCNTDIHRASYSRHSKSKKHLNQKEIKPKKIFTKDNKKESIKNKNDKIEYKFTENILNIVYDITVDSHHKKNLNSQITITSKHNDIVGIEMYHIDEIFKEMSHMYAKFIDQYKFKYQLTFMLLFYKFEEDGDIRREAEMTVTLNMVTNLTQSEIEDVNIQWDLEARKQNLELQASGWNFQRVNSMTISYYNTGNMDGSSYVKIPIRSSAILNIKNYDNYCFIWSILASLYPCKNNSNIVSSYRKYFDKLNIEGFDFSNGFKCSDMYRLEKLNNLSINIYELGFNQHNHKHKLIPIKISKNVSDKVIDLLIYENHYVLIKKLKVFIGKHDSKFICRKCLNSYTTNKALINHKKLCKENQVLRTSPESHIYWKKYFQKNKLYFRIYADFEADNEKEETNIGNKTTNIYKQEPVCNGYQIVSELEDILKTDYHKSPLGYENVIWFVDEMIKLENKIHFWFKDTKKDIIMTEEDKQDFENNNICRYCKKYIETDKVRDHCHLTGNYRGPAHNECNLKVKQADSNFITVGLHNFSNYDCHMFFKTLVDRKKDEIDFKILPKTDEKYISVTYGCIKFIDTYRFLTGSLDKLVQSLVDNTDKKLKDLKKEVFGCDKVLNIVENLINITDKNQTIISLKENYPNKINELEEALLDYMGDHDLKLLKKGFQINGNI